MFDADRPIVKNEQDKLGRTTFAKYLARCIIEHTNPESFVIGLYGGWGSGKTSIINLTLEELNAAGANMFDDERPIILNFSPWSYSGQNQLIFAFFRRLSSVIHQSPYLKEKEKIIYLLELYISFFTHKPIPRAWRLKKSFFQRIFHPLLTREDSYAWESGRDLTQVKAELNEVLSAQKHKFIIIIDNISRIEKEEIKQIFQIVKSMGDYANTVYLLSIDKESMTQTLGEESTEYLEKIIQLPFEVPTISKQDLENILLDRLKQIIETIPSEAWDTDYWADIYYATLKFFFENCRDITRYINTLNFGFSHVKEVVNPVDFFALTALNVFEPNVYYGIRDNKDLFTDLIDNVSQFDQQKLEEDRIRCDEVIGRAEKLPAEMIQQLLIRLFPRLRSMYNANIPFYHSEALARKNKRLCASDLFDVYFRLSMPSGYIPDAEVDAILAATHRKEDFALALMRLNQDNRITQFLDLLDGFIAIKVPLDNIPNVIDALMDSGDMFPPGTTSAVSFNTPMRIHRICHQLLRRFPSQEERFDIFHNAIKNAINSIYIIVHELETQESQHSPTDDNSIPVEDRDFMREQLDALEKTAVGKIAYWAHLGRLIEHPQLLPLLYAWKNWGDENACREYLLAATKNDRGVVAFLCAALNDAINQTMSKLERDASFEEALKNIEAFIPAKVIEPHVKELFEDLYFEKLREREQLAILIFLDLVKAETLKIVPKTTAF